MYEHSVDCFDCAGVLSGTPGKSLHHSCSLYSLIILNSFSHLFDESHTVSKEIELKVKVLIFSTELIFEKSHIEVVCIHSHLAGLC